MTAGGGRVGLSIYMFPLFLHCSERHPPPQLHVTSWLMLFFPSKGGSPYHASGWPDLCLRLLPYAGQWPCILSIGLCICRIKMLRGWDTKGWAMLLSTVALLLIWSKQVSWRWKRFPALSAHAHPRAPICSALLGLLCLLMLWDLVFFYWVNMIWPQKPAQFLTEVTVSFGLTRFFQLCFLNLRWKD